MKKRIFRWLFLAIAVLLLLCGVVATRPGVGRAFTFLQDLGPTRVTQGRINGDLACLFVFPAPKADAVRNALKTRLPKDGWTLSWERQGNLQYTRSGFRESVNFWHAGQLLSAEDFDDVSSDECGVLIQQPASWFEREIQAIRTRLHL